MLISTCLLLLDWRCKFILYHRSDRHGSTLLTSSNNLYFLLRSRRGSFSLGCRRWCCHFLSQLLLLLTSGIFCLSIFLGLLLGLHFLISLIFWLFRLCYGRCLFGGLCNLCWWWCRLLIASLLGRQDLALFFISCCLLFRTRFVSDGDICILRRLLLLNCLFDVFFSLGGHFNVNYLFFLGHKSSRNIKVQFSFCEQTNAEVMIGFEKVLGVSLDVIRGSFRRWLILILFQTLYHVLLEPC